MTDFSADIDLLFGELPFTDRCRAAKNSGFSAVEFTMPDNVPLGELGDAAAYEGLKTSVIQMPEDKAALAFSKPMKKDFLAAFENLADKADFLECRKILIPGKILEEDEFDDARDAFVSALHAATGKAKKYGIKILIGFKNGVENPGFYPASTLEVLEILDELNDDKAFGYLYDVYHAQCTEGGLSNTLESLSSLISHVRIAGVPMHEEPDTGEVNYDYLLSLLDAAGYDGYVGCSYTPRLKTADGLKWMKKYL